jgi:hypothetical protein
MYIAMGRRNKFQCPSKGKKLIAQLENLIQAGLKCAIENIPFVNQLIKHLASYTSLPRAIEMIIVTLADNYIMNRSPTKDVELLHDKRVLALIKRDSPKEFQNEDSQLMFRDIVLTIDELIVYYSKERPLKGKLSKVFEDIIVEEVIKGLEYSIEKIKELNDALKLIKEKQSKLDPIIDDDLILVYEDGE